MQRLCNALLTKHDDVIRTFFETMAAITRFTSNMLPTPTRSDLLDDLPLDLLVNATSDMTLTKDENGEFCVSFQDVFDVVFGNKPLSWSNFLKLSWAFFEVFIRSLVLYSIDFKTLRSTNPNDICFSEGTGLRQPLLRDLYNAQHLDPQHLHRR